MLRGLASTGRTTRRDLLRGTRGTPLRPPWALPEPLFTERCSGCAACVEACPEDVLTLSRDLLRSLPVVDYRRGECTFCGRCARSCPQGAIVPRTDQRPWEARAHLGERCLAFTGVECRVCVEQCEHAAIRVERLPGRVATPYIGPQGCTGCGACVAPCPASAIKVRPIT